MSTLILGLCNTPLECKLIIMNLAERVKQERIKLGISQAELAERINTREQMIHKIESGLIKTPRNIESIALALSTTPEYLLFGKRNDVSYSIEIPISDWGDINHKKNKKINFPINYFSLVIEDDSMTTSGDRVSYCSGTIIIVDPNIKPEFGKLVIARHKETGKMLFRKYTDFGMYPKLMPLNPVYDSFLIDDFYIVGVVVASMNFN